jgi:hypothetical protein
LLRSVIASYALEVICEHHHEVEKYDLTEETLMPFFNASLKGGDGDLIYVMDV